MASTHKLMKFAAGEDYKMTITFPSGYDLQAGSGYLFFCTITENKNDAEADALATVDWDSHDSATQTTLHITDTITGGLTPNETAVETDPENELYWAEIVYINDSGERYRLHRGRVLVENMSTKRTTV